MTAFNITTGHPQTGRCLTVVSGMEVDRPGLIVEAGNNNNNNNNNHNHHHRPKPKSPPARTALPKP
jgi:hypothetical protein